MAAYVITDSEITDQAVFDDYLAQVKAVVEAHGGKYLARGGATEVVQGDWTPRRIAVMEFDDVEQARAWQNSPDYVDLEGCSTGPPTPASLSWKGCEPASPRAIDLYRNDIQAVILPVAHGSCVMP